MSATSGRGEAAQISPKASAASMSGTASRAISQPAAASARIWASEPSTSVVLVLSIDWIETGAPPPTATGPTWIRFVSFRSIQCTSFQISLNVMNAINASSRIMPAAWI